MAVAPQALADGGAGALDALDGGGGGPPERNRQDRDGDEEGDTRHDSTDDPLPQPRVRPVCPHRQPPRRTALLQPSAGTSFAAHPPERLVKRPKSPDLAF